MKDSLLGRGLSWPLRVDADGRLARSADETNVREHIRLILATGRGERIGVPEFGAGLTEFLFEPNTPTTHRLIKGRVENALTRWEPRIRVEDVTVAADAQQPSRCIATVRFRLLASGQTERVSLAIDLARGGGGNG